MCSQEGKDARPAGKGGVRSLQLAVTWVGSFEMGRIPSMHGRKDGGVGSEVIRAGRQAPGRHAARSPLPHMCVCR